MITYGSLLSEAVAQTQDTSASTSVLLARAINQGARKFGAVLNRDWRLREQTFSTVASQVYFQTPEDCIRVKGVSIAVGSTNYNLTEISDDDTWAALTMRAQTSAAPMYFYVKGSDQFGIYPALSGAYTGTLAYEHSMRDMSQDDYTTGTVTVTNGSAAVVGSGTTWTASMVGRVLFITDGSQDGMGYKISAFTDATHITLENYYGGTTGGAKTYLIGEVPDIPEEFHESLIDYALYRYYRMRRDIPTSKEMKATFDEALLLAQQNYASKTSSSYYRPPRIQYAGYVQYPNTNRSI